jgi:hypothetical protein
VYEDKTVCIEWGNHIIGVQSRERAKHVDIRKHFAHEVMQNRHMRLIRVPPTDEQLADIRVFSISSVPTMPNEWRSEIEGTLSLRRGENSITTKFNWELCWNAFEG